MGALVLLCAPVVSAEQPGVESAEQMSIDDAVDLLGLFDEEEAAATDAQPAIDSSRDGDEHEATQAGPPASANDAAPSRAFGKALPPEAGASPSAAAPCWPPPTSGHRAWWVTASRT
jgi:hypothetical protein